MKNNSTELYSLIEVCTLCGNCNNTCPIFKIDLTEPESPRGRINLIKELMNGNVSDSWKLGKIMKSCLLCGNCNISCTKGVDFRKILIGYRSKSIFFKNLKKKNNIREKINGNIRKFTKFKNYQTDSDILLFPGYTVGRYYPEFIGRVIEIFNGIGLSVLVPDNLDNCQAYYKESGDMDGFEKALSINKEKLIKMSFDKMLCFSEKDVLIFKEDYDFNKIKISTLQEYLFLNYKYFRLNKNNINLYKKSAYHESLFEKNFINYSEDNKEFFNSNKIDLEIFHEDCCGSGINFEDNENGYSIALADRFIGKLNDNNIDNLIVSSPECYKWLSKFIPNRIVSPIEIFIN